MRFYGWLAALAAGTALWAWQTPALASGGCLTDCSPRIGIVSAFGAEADILVAQTRGPRTHVVNGNRFTTGVLRGNRVVIVLSGVSVVNATMVTQLMLDHFRVERLVMSGIAGGLNPALHVGDVTVPDRWLMSMEVYWNKDASVPGPCGRPTDVSCLGLKLATGQDGRPFPPPFALPSAQGAVPTGLFMRENFLMSARTAPQGEFVFDYPVDPAMLAVARGLNAQLARCGPRRPPAPRTTPGSACGSCRAGGRRRRRLGHRVPRQPGLPQLPVRALRARRSTWRRRRSPTSPQPTACPTSPFAA